MLDFAQYNTIDYILLIIVAVSAWSGILRGATHEIFSIGAWIFSVPLAVYIAPYLQEPLKTFVNNQTIVQYASLGIVYIISVSMLTLVSTTLSRIIRQSFLYSIDVVLGGVFGILRGVIITFVLYISLAMVCSQPQFPQSIQNAQLSKYVWSALYSSITFLRDNSIFDTIRNHTGYEAPVNIMLSRLQECMRSYDSEPQQTNTEITTEKRPIKDIITTTDEASQTEAVTTQEKTTQSETTAIEENVDISENVETTDIT